MVTLGSTSLDYNLLTTTTIYVEYVPLLRHSGRPPCTLIKGKKWNMHSMVNTYSGSCWQMAK